MSLNSITLTLFDIFGYILPGFVVLFAVSIFESSFTSLQLLNFTESSRSILTSTVVAYFLGHLCHSLAEGLYRIVNHFLKLEGDKLSEGLYRKLRKAEEEVYEVKITSDDQGAHRKEVYLMADSFLAAAGNVKERDSLVAREGFAKSSTAAFMILTLVLIVTLFKGGATIQTASQAAHTFNVWTSFIFVVLTGITTSIFFARFVFFRRLKINNIQLLFLAHVQKERLSGMKNK